MTTANNEHLFGIQCVTGWFENLGGSCEGSQDLALEQA
jgi:hypothetical protein